MRRMLHISALALVLTAPVWAFGQEGGDKKPVTLKGEIVDMHCFVSRGERGPDHAGCANACISRGVPAGFITDDGTLYVLLDEKPISVKEKVAGLAGKTVTVTGFPVERNGIKGLQLQSVKPD
ncbi:MAG: hypothetical protein IPF53_20965 [Blastocatellia bacterium]|nr:hypothetical protein [Blastocatellia bacterium]MBK6426094.1 hypothetical protein [Blastocatellia bacterium]